MTATRRDILKATAELFQAAGLGQVPWCDALDRLATVTGSTGSPAPYSEAMTLQGKAHLEAHGVEVVYWGRLAGVTNIYDETPERACELARQVDSPAAQAVLLSGVGLPTVTVLERLERELGKPVISSAAAMMWNALRAAGVGDAVTGFGSLLGGRR